ncbi:MAG: hypothetical protein R3C27_01110 [Hyphomonadaceae bacterium]
MSLDTVLHERWRAVARHFPAWAFGFDVFFNPGSYRFIGSDLTTSMRVDPRVKRAFAALEQTPSRMLEALSMMAHINVRRTDDAFKAIAVGYVTVPIALAALVSEAAPDITRSLILGNLHTIAPVLGVFIVTPVTYFCGAWRAKQIAWTIDLYRANIAAQERSREDQSS